MRRYLAIVMALVMCAACSSGNDNEHTTATTVVPPPPRQVLREERRPSPQTPANWHSGAHHGIADPLKPLLRMNLPDRDTFREGEEVAIDFSLLNAKLRGDGGEYRVRYIVDDDDMQWIDRWEQVVLTGWLPGKHTIRVELIGPDGWPVENGDFNISVREITIVK